jgi:hypothetical protein
LERDSLDDREQGMTDYFTVARKRK